jgi:fibronectin-binding autotransporter adhesin
MDTNKHELISDLRPLTSELVSTGVYSRLQRLVLCFLSLILLGISAATVSAQTSSQGSGRGGNPNQPPPVPSPSGGGDQIQPVPIPPGGGGDNTEPAPIDGGGGGITPLASQTWTGTTSGAWATGTNWSGGSPPGSTSNDSNGDTATFNNSTNTSITIDNDRNIKNITFDTSSAGPFVFSGGNGLRLTNGGAITINSGVTNSQTFNNNFLGSPNSGATSYSFINNSSTSGVSLTITGAITGRQTASTETFTFAGSNNGSVTGIISDGTGGGKVAVTKDGTGTWTLSGVNTYTGGTNINAGILNLGSAQTAVGGPLGGTGGVSTVGTITFNGGILQFSANNNTDYSSRFSNTAGQAFNIDTNGQNVTFTSQIISTAGGAAGTLTKLGTGTLTLTSSLSRYTGATTIDGGTLTATTIANGGSDSSIGRSTNAATNLVFGGGTLQHTAANVASTDRLFTIGDASGLTATIDSSAVSSTNTLSFSNGGSIAFGGTGARTLTLTGTNTGNNTFAPILGDGPSGATSLIKSGAGTWVLTGASTYTGTTQVSSGTLSIDNNNTTTARLANTSGITVNAGGTLLLSQSGVTASTDRINDSATMTLNGGTFNTGGLSEHGGTNNTAGIGALTLQSSSIINMGSGTSIVAFADSSTKTWTGTLSIYNWSGDKDNGGGTDQLYFGTDTSGLTAAQLAEVQFYSGNGTGAFTTGAILLANGELVPVPEPSTYAAAAMAFVTLLITQRRRLKKLAARS